MLHDSILGVELLLRQFQNLFAWWMKWKNLDHYVNIFFTQIWNFGSLCDHYEMKNTLFDTGFLNRLIYWYWVWKPNFFIIKKIVFFNISNRPNRLNRIAKNRTAIGRKTVLKQCASVPIMKKPIYIGLVINLEKNRPYRTTHTPTLSTSATGKIGNSSTIYSIYNPKIESTGLKLLETKFVWNIA